MRFSPLFSAHSGPIGKLLAPRDSAGPGASSDVSLVMCCQKTSFSKKRARPTLSDHCSNSPAPFGSRDGSLWSWQTWAHSNNTWPPCNRDFPGRYGPLSSDRVKNPIFATCSTGHISARGGRICPNLVSSCSPDPATSTDVQNVWISRL